ncbi:hypothetical protein FACS1894190_14700 [Spirochaetia bacterium]|nr:hypothetical protein FACS1894190_14700 [Spirochaetia bacterium]
MNTPGDFKKGDPRCWRKGRPKKGTALSDILRDRVDGKARESIELNTGYELDAKLTAILGSRK